MQFAPSIKKNNRTNRQKHVDLKTIKQQNDIKESRLKAMVNTWVLSVDLKVALSQVLAFLPICSTFV